MPRNAATRATRRFERHVRPNNIKLSPYNRNVLDGRTVFRAMVSAVIPGKRILISGKNNLKIGSHVVKGAWAGMPIFTLTLEERATCPTSCKHYLDCYGNSLHWSTRWQHGPELTDRLASEITDLAHEFRRGFVVRLHVLGDFFSTAYVEFWAGLLVAHPELRIFGYTAWQPGTEIGDAVAAVRANFGRQFAIRHSDAPPGSFGTRTIKTADEARPGEIVCPAQTGRVGCCGECGLCWQSPRTVAFLEH